MSKYTYKDIIIDPTSEEAKNCIGKMVYFASNPSDCLCYANNNSDYFCKILQSIEVDKSLPFVIRTDDNIFYTKCFSSTIILKKEPKPKYIPFESANEFAKAYRDAYPSGTRGDAEILLCSFGGIWLKRKCDSLLIAKCIEISDKGVALGLNRQVTLWNELLENYEFPDGTPCGKLKVNEVSNG